MFIRLASLAFLGLAAPAWADDFVPGRPGNTESPISVPAGRWQLETEIASYARAGDDRNWSALQTDLRYGLASGWDVEAIVSPYSRTVVGGDSEAGVGDTTLRLRHTFTGQDGEGPAFAMIGFVTLPTASSGQGDGAIEGGAIATGAFNLSDKIGVTYTLGVAGLSDHGDYRSDVYGGVAVSRQFGDRLGGYIEAFADRSEHQTAATLDVGMTYLASVHTQWDAGVDLGVTGAADDARLFVGYAHLF